MDFNTNTNPLQFVWKLLLLKSYSQPINFYCMFLTAWFVHLKIKENQKGAGRNKGRNTVGISAG